MIAYINFIHVIIHTNVHINIVNKFIKEMVIWYTRAVEQDL